MSEILVKSNITIINANKTQDEKIRRSIRLIMAVVNGPNFRGEVLKCGYERHYVTGAFFWRKYFTEWVDGFTATKETNQEVYIRIMSGSTEDDELVDVEFDLTVNVIKGGGGKVIGYTTPRSDRTNTYEWVVNEYEDFELAGHIFHEYLHRAHYDHISAKDHNSVPYKLGYLMERMAKELMAVGITA